MPGERLPAFMDRGVPAAAGEYRMSYVVAVPAMPSSQVAVQIPGNTPRLRPPLVLIEHRPPRQARAGVN